MAFPGFSESRLFSLPPENCGVTVRVCRMPDHYSRANWKGCSEKTPSVFSVIASDLRTQTVDFETTAKTFVAGEKFISALTA